MVPSKFNESKIGAPAIRQIQYSRPMLPNASTKTTHLTNQSTLQHLLARLELSSSTVTASKLAQTRLLADRASKLAQTRLLADRASKLAQTRLLADRASKLAQTRLLADRASKLAQTRLLADRASKLAQTRLLADKHVSAC